jgi:hypothetical protein
MTAHDTGYAAARRDVISRASPGQRRALLPLLLLAGCLAVPADAHLPEYFGRRFVLEPPVPTAPAPESCGGSPEEREALRGQVAAMDRELEARTRTLGAYSPLLADPSGELAELHARLCNHPAALDALRRAIQALRVNDGLLSEAQIPYLRAMARSYAAIGDYESAQRSLRYGFRVHNLGRGPLSPAALRDSLAYFERAREILLDPRSPRDLDLYFEAYEDNRAMYEAQWARFEAGEGPSYAVMKAIALSHLSNLYMILGTDLDAYGMSAVEAATSGTQFLQRSQLLTYSRGRKVLEGLLDAPQAAEGVERAGLLLRLGNWQQWNGKWQSSCDSYEASWAAATGADGAALRARLAEPAELPEEPELWRFLQGPDIPVRAVVEASFSVNARGDITRVNGKTVGEGSGGRILRWLRDSHARPAIRDGACVSAELAGRRYRLVD